MEKDNFPGFEARRKICKLGRKRFTSVKIYHCWASLSELHTDLIICLCTKQDLSHTSRYLDKSSPGIAYVCQQLGQLLSVWLHMDKLSFTVKSRHELNFVLPVGNLPLMICNKQGVCVLQLQPSQSQVTNAVHRQYSLS